MVIQYQTAKFKSANILAIAILDSTAKFNCRQYFQLYNIVYLVFAYCIYNVMHMNKGVARHMAWHTLTHNHTIHSLASGTQLGWKDSER